MQESDHFELNTIAAGSFLGRNSRVRIGWILDKGMDYMAAN
jgi:hypothetical protein